MTLFKQNLALGIAFSLLMVAGFNDNGRVAMAPVATTAVPSAAQSEGFVATEVTKSDAPWAVAFLRNHWCASSSTATAHARRNASTCSGVSAKWSRDRTARSGCWKTERARARAGC